MKKNFPFHEITCFLGLFTEIYLRNQELRLKKKMGSQDHINAPCLKRKKKTYSIFCEFFFICTYRFAQFCKVLIYLTSTLLEDS